MLLRLEAVSSFSSSRDFSYIISQIILCQWCLRLAPCMPREKSIQFEGLPCANPTLHLIAFQKSLLTLKSWLWFSHKGLFTAEQTCSGNLSVFIFRLDATINVVDVTLDVTVNFFSEFFVFFSSDIFSCCVHCRVLLHCSLQVPVETEFDHDGHDHQIIMMITMTMIKNTVMIMMMNIT